MTLKCSCNDGIEHDWNVYTCCTMSKQQWESLTEESKKQFGLENLFRDTTFTIYK